MKTRNEQFMMVVAALVVLMVVAGAGFQFVTDRHRSAAVERFKKPAGIERYKKAHEARDGKPAVPPDQAGRQPSGEIAPVAVDPDENVKAFQAAVAQGKALREGVRGKEFQNLFDMKLPKEGTEAEWARAKTAMDEARGLIQEIRRLAKAGGPVSTLDFSQGFNMQLPHLAQLREFERLLSADAYLWAHEGKYGEAVEDILAGMQLSSILCDEPILISQLVRIAMNNITYDAAQQALPAENFPPDLARRLIDYAGRIDGRDSFSESFQGEGFFGLDAFEQFRDGRLDSGVIQTSSWTDNLLLQAYGSTLARPWLNMDEETYSDIIGRVADLSQRPYYEARPLMDEVQQEVDNLPITRVFSRIMLPALTRTLEAQAMNEARLDLMQIGLSLEQYRARTGTLPDTLDPIASSLGGAVPVDPFTGTPYVYRPSGGGFLLYSVGRNQTDDGGRQESRTGDIVWRGEREP